MPEFIDLANELEYYSFIRIDRNKRDAKNSYLYLNTELDELIKELQNQEAKQAQMFWTNCNLDLGKIRYENY